MRSRVLIVLAASALLLGVAMSFAPAGAGPPRPSRVGFGGARHVSTSDIVTGVLWNQLNKGTGVGMSSQNFTDPGFDPFDDSGADDFTVPTGMKWKIKGIRASGVYWDGYGPCDSETVTFYRNDGPGGRPGTVIATRTGTGTDVAGTITLALVPSVNLLAGTYWVGFVCTMNFGVGGEWAWNLRSPATDFLGQWEDPLDGFGTGCSTWSDVIICSGFGDDYMFALVGQAV